MRLIKSKWLLPITMAAAIIIVITLIARKKNKDSFPVAPGIKGFEWKAPDTSQISLDEAGKFIRYGRDLIAHTSYYLGPKGTIAAITNGMNCQNCHLEAG